MERETFILTKQAAQDIVWEDSLEFEVVLDEIKGKSRWKISHNLIVKRLSDGKFFKTYYLEGATEYQDEAPFEYTEPKFTEVFAVEKTIVVYE